MVPLKRGLFALEGTVLDLIPFTYSLLGICEMDFSVQQAHIEAENCCVISCPCVRSPQASQHYYSVLEELCI